MIENKKVTVVMPARNIAKTLRQTVAALPEGIVDDIILVDNCSSDDTVKIAEELGLYTIRHDKNRGYGGSQKTLYKAAQERGADIVVMVHPDFQYNPRLTGAMAWMVAEGNYEIVLGSRMIDGGARKGGMPLYKYISNRALTIFQNLVLRKSISEYHTGFRAFRRSVLEDLPLHKNSDITVFDNQMLAQAVFHGMRIGELSCPAKYFKEASSLDFFKSSIYGLGVLMTTFTFAYAKLVSPKGTIFEK